MSIITCHIREKDFETFSSFKCIPKSLELTNSGLQVLQIARIAKLYNFNICCTVGLHLHPVFGCNI